MCSAPWYWNILRTSLKKEIIMRYASSAAILKIPSMTLNSKLFEVTRDARKNGIAMKTPTARMIENATAVTVSFVEIFSSSPAETVAEYMSALKPIAKVSHNASVPLMKGI